MRKGTIKAVVLIIIFIASVLIFGKLTNHNNEDMTTEMEEAKLPVISLYQNDTEMNRLHGYVNEMNAAYMRDTITPIPKDRLLPIVIQTYETPVDAISYEIRSLDASRLIANAEVASYKEEQGKIHAELEIQNLLEKGTEYLLILRLESGSQSICYYTRIIEQESHVEECIDFVLDFHDKTFNKETTGSLATYMEKTTGDNSTLHYVSLNSSLKQLGWADFEGERLAKPIPSVKEITDTYNVIVLDYVVTRVGDNGESEYYNVEEYYRVRYTTNRIYLLNFERVMEQIFRGESCQPYEQYLPLGIRSSEVEYRTNESATAVAFVQEGELWSYHMQANTLAKVFSFRGYEGIDERENYGEHDIKIVGVDETGSVDYLVYGYMNRGAHEGEVGLAVYHYDSVSNTNEEQVFIASDKSYQMLKAELGQLMYVNEAGELFLMMNGTVYGVELGTRNVREVVNNLQEGAYAVSNSGRYIAWCEAKKGMGGSVIRVMDLSDMVTTEISAENGTLVKPLGFMEEDFVYGIARESDIFADAVGSVAFPMYQVKIVDVTQGALTELKIYEKTGYYVDGVQIEGSAMYLERMRKSGTDYVPAEGDMIMNRESEAGGAAEIATAVSEEKQTEVLLKFQEVLNEKTPKLLTPKETILLEERVASLPQKGDAGTYYVYVKGEIAASTENVAAAVQIANETMGVVLDSDQRYIWKRARKTAQPRLSDIAASTEDASAGSIAQCMNVMLQKEGLNMNVQALLESGETPKSVLRNTLKERTVLDLTGCSTDEILYYVSLGTPVFAMTGNDSAVLVVGYDSTGVLLYEPGTDATVRKTLAEADALFANAGNVFFTYLLE